MTSLVALCIGVPLLLSLHPEPILPISDCHITGDPSTCRLVQPPTLSDSGNRAGIATMTSYVDGGTYETWVFRVVAPATMGVGQTVFVDSCSAPRAAGVSATSRPPHARTLRGRIVTLVQPAVGAPR